MSDEPERISFEVVDESEPSTPDRAPQPVFALQLNGVLHMIEHGMVGAVTSTDLRQMNGRMLSMLRVHLKSGQILEYGPVGPAEASAVIAMCFGHPLHEPVDNAVLDDETGRAS